MDACFSSIYTICGRSVSVYTDTSAMHARVSVYTDTERTLML